MHPKKYSSIMAENGSLGGIAKAKKYAKYYAEKFRSESQQVYNVAMEFPNMKQKEIAQKTGLAQSFVSGVITPRLKLLRLQKLLGKTISIQQIELWRLELEHCEMVIKPRKKASAL